MAGFVSFVQPSSPPTRGSSAIAALAPGLLHTHISAAMRKLVGERTGWLTMIQLPAYAPGLNPVEVAWANMQKQPGQP